MRALSFFFSFFLSPPRRNPQRAKECDLAPQCQVPCVYAAVKTYCTPLLHLCARGHRTKGKVRVVCEHAARALFYALARASWRIPSTLRFKTAWRFLNARLKRRLAVQSRLSCASQTAENLAGERCFLTPGRKSRGRKLFTTRLATFSARRNQSETREKLWILRGNKYERKAPTCALDLRREFLNGIRGTCLSSSYTFAPHIPTYSKSFQI